jgi:hypothetical protein
VGGRVPKRLAMLTTTVCALALAPAAGAATTVGQTFFPTSSGSCNGTPAWEVIQTATLSGVSYSVPANGVLTSWSFHAGADPTTLTMTVFRPTPVANQYTVIGNGGELRTVAAASGVSTFPARVPVQIGDFVGIRSSTGTCASAGSGADIVRFRSGAATPVGGTANLSGTATVLYEISAQLEPDADNDGFGDETQDACPTDPALQDEPCDRIAPSSTITKGPKDKTKKKTATFEFSATDARAVAGFQCSLDGGAFAACSSPHTIKVKRGKHTFSVRATDQAGNVDATPATDSWKVKKKKKKKKRR